MATEAPPVRTLCPFWSRIAETPKGLLALCSYDDLEVQRENGYGEPEGWTRLEKCKVNSLWGRKTAVDLPSILLDGIVVAVCDSRSNPIYELEGAIGITLLRSGDYDGIWQAALDWAHEEG